MGMQLTLAFVLNMVHRKSCIHSAVVHMHCTRRACIFIHDAVYMYIKLQRGDAHVDEIIVHCV